MSAGTSWRLRLVSGILVLLLMGASIQFLFPHQAAAQTSWSIVVDNSINEGAIEGSVSNMQTGTNWVKGNLAVTNNKMLWWKVYVSTIGNVTVDTSDLFVDEGGHYFLLAPKGNSATKAIPTLPSSVTFHQPNSGVLFYADRTIESGFAALVLQVADICLIALTGSGVPTSVADIALQILQAPAFVQVAYALGQDPPDLLGAVQAISAIASDDVALAQLQYLLSQLGVSMTIDQIRDAFVVTRIFQILVVIYDMFTSPFADAVSFHAAGEAKPLIAAISCSGTWGYVPLTVNFDASGSYSPQYPIQSYEWNFDDGTTATGVTATHTYSGAGKHAVTLTITDSQGRQSTARKSITVLQPRIQVSMGATKFHLVFDAGSLAEVLFYSWDFGDGGTAMGKVVEHTYGSPGQYLVILSLGLDASDRTQGWVPWVPWATIKVTVQEDTSPAGWHFSVGEYDSAPKSLSVNGIVVEDADEIWTNSLECSGDLENAAKNVAPRIVVEYADSMAEFSLQGSEDLDQVASAASPRIIVEYADSIAEFSLQGSQDLNQVASAASPRIVVEYADSVAEFRLQGSEDLNQVASGMSPRIIVEYADSIFAANLERPAFVPEVNLPPYQPSNPSPANHATGVSIDADLSWSGGDPNAGDTVTYDVYFGTGGTPSLKETIGPYPATESSITYGPDTLVDGTMYYWQIIARDNHGITAGGSVWDFTTGKAGDVDGDGNVNVLDMVRVGQHWGQAGSPGWIPEDVKEDGVINVLDIIIVGQHWTG